jgi:hypothetical protein
MLTAEMASTTTKPSMIFPRNRKLGNFSDISRGMRFNNLASSSRKGQHLAGECRLPGLCVET